MILVESITITEFRGIRKLTIDFNGNNFAICGPNGTGKSGVVDALEFALTGNVSRLSGEGSGDISLKEHGPHVDMRNDPDKTRVTVKVAIPSLSKTVTIQRNLKTPGVAHVTPSDPSVLDVLRQVKTHPEIVLSRRELIRYVLATPGKRSEEVQALLRLEQVEQVRIGLQKIANSCERQLGPLGGAVAQAREKLLRALEISELKREKVLIAANAQRTILGLPLIGELTTSTSLKDGMAAPVLVQPQRIPKTQALADLKAGRTALDELASASTITRVDSVTADLNLLASDPAIAEGVKRESFYTTGIELIRDEVCPFCDTSWDLVILKQHVQAKINCLAEIARKRTAIETKMAPLILLLQKVQATINTLVSYASLATPPVRMDAARDYGSRCGTTAERLGHMLSLTEAIAALTNLPVVPTVVLDDIGELEKRVVALPEPTKQDAAREWLAVAQVRLEIWRDAVLKEKAAKEKAQTARQISDAYVSTSNSVLVLRPINNMSIMPPVVSPYMSMQKGVLDAHYSV